MQHIIFKNTDTESWKQQMKNDGGAHYCLQEWNQYIW